MRNVLAIAKKELNVYFTTPVAYVVFAVMSVIASYFFIAAVKQFLDASMMAMQMPQYRDPSQLNLTDYVIAPVVFNMGIFFAFVTPLVSMRLIAEEKRHKTFELLMTAPLRPYEIVLGKYLGGLIIVGVTVLLLMLLPVILHFFAASAGTGGAGGIEWQTTLAAYFGLFLWSATALAVGLFISALTDSQVVAAIISILMLLLLWLASWMASGAEGTIRDVLSYLSASQHLVGFVRGSFELKDVVYYLSWIVLAIFLTHRAVEAQRWA
ncbi:MAG: ABC transporter permease [Deltaproteobacteria bacterium]|nr:ABC transporter permease [Deltaproteobacteria bacterium]